MNDDHFDYVNTVREVLWEFGKGLVILLCIAVIMFSCSYFVEEQGSAAWFPKSSGGR